MVKSVMVKQKFIVHITNWLHKKDNKSAVNAKCLFYAIEIKEVYNFSHPLMLTQCPKLNMNEEKWRQ